MGKLALDPFEAGFETLELSSFATCLAIETTRILVGWLKPSGLVGLTGTWKICFLMFTLCVNLLPNLLVLF